MHSQSSSIRVVLRKVLQPFRRVTLGPLQGQSQCPIPIQLTQTSHGPRHSEQHGVILELRETIMPEQHTRVRVHIGIRVGYLSVLGQNTGHEMVNGIDDFEKRVIGHVLQSELALAGVPRVRLTKDGVSVARNDLFGIERLPREFGNGVGIHLLALLLELGLQRLDPLEDLLVGESVEGSGEGVESGGVGEVGIREGGSDKVGGVRGGISSLVIGVDAEVESHEFVEAGIVVSKHAAEVARIIKGLILGHNTVEVDIAVDGSGNFRKESKNVENVLQGILVILILGHSIGVRLGKDRSSLSRTQPNRKLRHGMHLLGKGVEKRNDMRRELGTALVKFLRESIDLFLGGNLGREQEPNEGFEERFTFSGLAGKGWKDLLTIRNSQSTKPNPLLGIQIARLPQHALHAARSAQQLIDGHVANDFGAVFFL
mmetsp:Transcript_16815/g.28950  ORF Transcript_16815/g.28950 Transcript_16815/m.28950 type:complete len:428 (+) Transcript_16815:215-1498(+)